MPRSPALDPAHSGNCRAEWPSRSILETSAPPNSASWNWSAQSGTQSEDASSATLAAVTFTNHLAIQHMQCRKQGGRAVALVVVRHRNATAFLQRETRLRPI